MQDNAYIAMVTRHTYYGVIFDNTFIQTQNTELLYVLKYFVKELIKVYEVCISLKGFLKKYTYMHMHSYGLMCLPIKSQIHSADTVKNHFLNLVSWQPYRHDNAVIMTTG